MTGTTDSIWGGAAHVGVSSDGASWTEISSHGMKVSPEGGDRRVGEAYVFDSEDPITKVGKKNARDTRVDFVYTEIATDAFEVVRTQFEAAGGGSLYVRWSPNGGAIGDAGYTTNLGYVSDLRYPEVDSEADGPILTYFVIHHGALTRSVLATAW